MVMPDANLDKATDAIISSAFGAAGERCLAGSILVAVGGVAQPLLEVLLEKTKKLKVGDGQAEGTDMGPLVTSDHHKRVSGFVDKGVAEGAIPLCDGRRNGTQQGYFLGPTIFDHVTPEMTIAREEIFGPRVVGHAGGYAGSGHRPDQRQSLWKYDVHLHERREVRTGIFTSHRCRDGRGEYRCSCANGLLSVRRLERFVFRRPACAWERCHRVLYGTESDHDALVLRTQLTRLINNSRKGVCANQFIS